MVVSFRLYDAYISLDSLLEIIYLLLYSNLHRTGLQDNRRWLAGWYRGLGRRAGEGSPPPSLPPNSLYSHRSQPAPTVSSVRNCGWPWTMRSSPPSCSDFQTRCGRVTWNWTYCVRPDRPGLVEEKLRNGRGAGWLAR